ncbi:hypothetical protein BDN72DRAFT_781523 [Pluteus cervinus]|uniref:Uncharacterized protein n=1 Tax=Pluteus cervinus TaxID=181527 RepID=A0ACD2ZZ02_9AGAR|nr:hypothetical protein BDN72DRAFT_781523 [Pluteus cervinus]
MADSSSPADIDRFFQQAQKIMNHARFISDSIPNADPAAVQNIVQQLNTLYDALSVHNVRIERLWRDVRRDTIELFRQTFLYLEELELLDMDNPAHRIALFLVYHPRIQKSLDETLSSWNQHKMRTEHNISPIALYELSREAAITGGYWTGDPGDDIGSVGNEYGSEPGKDDQPVEDAGEDEEVPDEDMGILINSDDEIERARELLGEVDFEADDEAGGIDVYCEIAIRLSQLYAQHN